MPPLALLFLLLGAVQCSSTTAGQPVDLDSIPGAEYARALELENDGMGIAVLPARFDGARLVEILDPAGYRLHLTDAEAPGAERIYRAGALVLPPSGRWRVWLQGESSMTPFTDLLILGSNRRPGSRSVKPMPVIPAGRVVAAKGTDLGPDLQLRVLYAGGDPIAGLVRHELSRRRELGELEDGILMPEGPVIASLWDDDLKRYVALSRPFQVEAGETNLAPLERPAPTASHLIVYTERSADARASSLPGLALEAVQQGIGRPPNATVTTPWGMYGFWYDLKPGRVELSGGNERLYLEPARIELRGGQIARFQATLSTRPSSTDGSTTEQGAQ